MSDITTFENALTAEMDWSFGPSSRGFFCGCKRSDVENTYASDLYRVAMDMLKEGTCCKTSNQMDTDDKCKNCQCTRCPKGECANCYACVLRSYCEYIYEIRKQAIEVAKM